MTDPVLDRAIQRVLVTGGAGFIGSNVVDALLAAGRDVSIYDNFRTGRREFVAAALAARRHPRRGRPARRRAASPRRCAAATP